MNIINQKKPRRLFDYLESQSYKERRKPNELKFRDCSLKKVGYNCLGNRAMQLFSEIKPEVWLGSNKHEIRILLKALLIKF